MKRLAISFLAALAGVSIALARSSAPPATNCALEAQRSVAKRHGLGAAADGSLSMRIYGDPRLAQEADDAFDACIRRQPSP